MSSWFGWNATPASDELPELFPVPISQSDFVQTDVVAIYSKILTDVLERTHGLSDDQVALMWDNCVKSSSSDGLVTLLAKAMADKRELFLVFEKAVSVIREANPEEARQIRADYEKSANSSKGIFISFKNFKRSDMVKFYVGIDYCTVGALYKSSNLSKAVQIKIADLRGSVALIDAADAKGQAQRMAAALAAGKDVLLDAKDVIETARPDLSATKDSIAFTVQKLCFYLGMPDSYLSGEQTSGMGTTGENDMRATERGLKSYFFSIVKPTLEALFGIKADYKSQDTRQILGSIEVLKTFSLVDDELVSHDNKLKLVNMLLGLPEDAKGDAPKKPAAAPAPASGIPPKKPAPPISE